MVHITRVPLARVRVEELARLPGRLIRVPALLVTQATTASFKPAINVSSTLKIDCCTALALLQRLKKQS